MHTYAFTHDGKAGDVLCRLGTVEAAAAAVRDQLGQQRHGGGKRVTRSRRGRLSDSVVVVAVVVVVCVCLCVCMCVCKKNSE